MIQKKTLALAALIALALAAGCADDDPPTSSGNNDKAQDMSAAQDMSSGGDMAPAEDMSDPPEEDMKEPAEEDMRPEQDMAPEVDMAEEDMAPTLRTLPDYRVCEQDEDCPVGLGSCVKSIPYNRALPDGTTSVAVSALFDGVEDGQGVCTEACTNTPEACAALSFNGLTPDPRPHTCQVVALGPSPYPDAPPAFPFADTLDPEELAAGQPFAALCRPPFELDAEVDEGMCSPCQDGQSACPGSSLCYDMLREQPAADGNAGTCLAPCDASGGCPMGFTCEAVADGAGGMADVCKPATGTCSDCLDLDGDGVGAGRCSADENSPVTGVDCDDRDRNIYYDALNPTHPFPMFCGEQDYNCNGLSDAAEQVGTPQFGAEHCTQCGDACAGSIPGGFASRSCQPGDLDGGMTTAPGSCIALCDDPAARVDCNGDIMDGCEVEISDPSRIYWKDDDGDGFGDPSNATFNCDPMTPPMGYAPSMAGEDCNDDPDSGGAEDYPGADELCDGRDNDCDTEVDESPFVEEGAACAVSGGQGICATGAYTCEMGALVCAQTVSPIAESCDYVDTDCDGVVDNLDSLCPRQQGVCAGAVQICGDIRVGFSTVPNVPTCEPYGEPSPYELNSPDYDGSTETSCNDNLDNDCDGLADCFDSNCKSAPNCDNFCPTNNETRLCANQSGVCSGATQRCVSNTWTECNYQTHSTDYRSSENDQFYCQDGLDNDCDGQTDCDDSGCAPTAWCQNFCPTNGATRLCPKQAGVCKSSRETCVGNQWSGCDDTVYGNHSSDYVANESSYHCDDLDNDCDGTVDDGCPIVGEGGFSVGSRYRVEIDTNNDNLPDREFFGSGSGPIYELYCPNDFVVTKLHLYHNNDTAHNYAYNPNMRIIRVGVTCGRPAVVKTSPGNYVADIDRRERRYPSSSYREYDVSGRNGPSYPKSGSGDYVGTWGWQNSSDDWAILTVPWWDEMQHSTIDCDGNSMMRASKIKAGGWIDAMGGKCYDVTINPSTPSNMLNMSMESGDGFYGGTGAAPSEYDVPCEAGDALVGVWVQMRDNGGYREWVGEVSFLCAPVTLNLIQD